MKMQRIERVRAALRAQGLTQMIVCDPKSVWYLTGVDDLNQTFELLLSGRIDATLNAEMTFYDYTKEHPDANVKIAVLTDDANQIAIPMRKGDETATLRTAIDAAIDELRTDGTLKELSEKYFGADISSES